MGGGKQHNSVESATNFYPKNNNFAPVCNCQKIQNTPMSYNLQKL